MHKDVEGIDREKKVSEITDDKLLGCVKSIRLKEFMFDDKYECLLVSHNAQIDGGVAMLLDSG